MGQSRDKLGRIRQAGSAAGRSGLPSREAASTGRKLQLSPPYWLGNEGGKWYRWAAKLANEMGIADEADENVYCLAAETFQEMRDAQELVIEHGQVVVGADQGGNKIVRKNPAVQIVQSARETMRRFYSDLGLTPAARAKFAGGAGGEKDPFEALLSQ